ncbi:class I SAM-dependent methyltransferase [Olsenella sp. HMSC062G07]|uniref:class I SAM-dependent methyltransferase n=1 Tax=Olsenella sp. HMSC062G07 TaxID=1739330 RepID=UPI0008A5A919|nr:class I SAM-dependent methyltransferase [Olsenella sp. HMSC062G07]OFK24793.1 hypothetical protein HMPREF2826_06090 [Olsenella sp. HMSC062G07]
MDDEMSEREVTQAGDPSRPTGACGSRMLRRMNRSHAALTNWALDLLPWRPGLRALDVGCGGGATMRRILDRIARAGAGAGEGQGHVSGVDYSSVSCAESRAFNEAALRAGLMDVTEASVDRLPFPDASFDVVTTVESFYFWPDPARDLREVRRVLRPRGRFLLVCDVYRRDDLPDETLANIREHDLTVLEPWEYRNLLLAAGFSSAVAHLKEETSWIAVEGVC